MSGKTVYIYVARWLLVGVEWVVRGRYEAAWLADPGAPELTDCGKVVNVFVSLVGTRTCSKTVVIRDGMGACACDDTEAQKCVG